MNKRIVDLRSDTVTKPSPEMWKAVKAMDNSKLGDDVIGEDPTVNELESRAAKLMGKDAALMVTSGTQGNLISLLSQTHPGDEILTEELSHIYYYEVAGSARLGGLLVKTFSSEKGTPNVTQLENLVRVRNDIHQPWTTLLAVENTHNKHGGTIITPQSLHELREFTLNHEIKLHIDGARIFNAAIALKLPVTAFTQYCDSISFCLSKGLSCPIGSIIVGTTEFIEKARKFRKMLGGGWRQAGILAQFGLVALEDTWIQRLAQDHTLAKRLAKGLEANPFLKVQDPQTNIVMVTPYDYFEAAKLATELADHGVLAWDMKKKIRFVTHYGITEEDIDYAIEIINSIVSKE